MKKLLLLSCLCLLLAGCNPRSRQPSENYIPSDGHAAAAEQQNPSSTEKPTVQPGGEDLDGPGAGTVKQVLFREGDYTYGGAAVHYSYALPMVDLPSDHAMGCNQEIEFRFGNPIREALSEMEHAEPLSVQTVRYTEDRYGSVLTVRIYRTDVDGEESQGIYSLNAVTGDAPTYQEFLAAAGLQENRLPELLNQAVTVRFRETVGDRFRESDSRYQTALNQTLNGISDPSLLNMHLTEDGKLAIYVTVFDPEGGSDLQQLILP